MISFETNQDYLVAIEHLVNLFVQAAEKSGQDKATRLYVRSRLTDGYRSFYKKIPEHNDFPMERLRTQYALSEFAYFCLALGYLAKAEPAHSTPAPTLGYALTLWRNLRPMESRELAPLVTTYGNLLFGGQMDKPPLTLPISLGQSTVGWLQNQAVCPAAGVCRLVSPDDTKVSLRPALFEELSTTGKQLLSRNSPHLMILSGPHGVGKQYLVECLASHWNRTLLTVDWVKFDALSQVEKTSVTAQISTLLTLEPYLLHLRNYSSKDGENQDNLPDILSHSSNLTFVTTTQEDLVFTDSTLPTRFVTVSIPRWQEALPFWDTFSAGCPLEHTFQELSSTFLLTPRQIIASLENAKLFALGSDILPKKVLQQAILQESTTGLSTLATPVKVAYSWDDLLLDPGQKNVLRLVANKVQYQETVLSKWGFGKKLAYGRGVSILFYGPPGTGKTMGAQVLAGEIGLALFRVDLSKIISKYIGETEKNLSVIFREAKNANVILFFDEADALFSKRTEVKDSKDKYANVETSYLLQKMEEHDGVSILATNRLANFDEAFKRRIDYMVGFEVPNEETRLALWKGMFPPEAPIDPAMDWEFLASHFNYTGSMIKNVVVNAAYLAAARSQPIAMVDIIRSIQAENSKAGIATWNEDYGPYGYLLS